MSTYDDDVSTSSRRGDLGRRIASLRRAYLESPGQPKDFLQLAGLENRKFLQSVFSLLSLESLLKVESANDVKRIVKIFNADDCGAIYQVVCTVRDNDKIHIISFLRDLCGLSDNEAKLLYNSSQLRHNTFRSTLHLTKKMWKRVLKSVKSINNDLVEHIISNCKMVRATQDNNSNSDHDSTSSRRRRIVPKSASKSKPNRFKSIQARLQQRQNISRTLPVNFLKGIKHLTDINSPVNSEPAISARRSARRSSSPRILRRGSEDLSNHQEATQIIVSPNQSTNSTSTKRPLTIETNHRQTHLSPSSPTSPSMALKAILPSLVTKNDLHEWQKQVQAMLEETMSSFVTKNLPSSYNDNMSTTSNSSVDESKLRRENQQLQKRIDELTTAQNFHLSQLNQLHAEFDEIHSFMETQRELVEKASKDRDERVRHNIRLTEELHDAHDKHDKLEVKLTSTIVDWEKKYAELQKQLEKKEEELEKKLEKNLEASVDDDEEDYFASVDSRTNDDDDDSDSDSSGKSSSDSDKNKQDKKKDNDDNKNNNNDENNDDNDGMIVKSISEHKLDEEDEMDWDDILGDDEEKQVQQPMKLIYAEKGLQFSLDQALRIGRTVHNDIQIKDPLVSGFHAMIRDCMITDPRSTNGTFVNGVEVPKNTPWPLKEGDEVSVGDSVLLVAYGEPYKETKRPKPTPQKVRTLSGKGPITSEQISSLWQAEAPLSALKKDAQGEISHHEMWVLKQQVASLRKENDSLRNQTDPAKQFRERRRQQEKEREWRDKVENLEYQVFYGDSKMQDKIDELTKENDELKKFIKSNISDDDNDNVIKNLINKEENVSNNNNNNNNNNMNLNMNINNNITSSMPTVMEEDNNNNNNNMFDDSNSDSTSNSDDLSNSDIESEDSVENVLNNNNENDASATICNTQRELTKLKSITNSTLPYYKLVSSSIIYNRLSSFNPFIIIDTRSPQQYKSGHITNAINIPVPMDAVVGAKDIKNPSSTPLQIKQFHLTNRKDITKIKRVLGQLGSSSNHTIVVYGNEIAEHSPILSAEEAFIRMLGQNHKKEDSCGDNLLLLKDGYNQFIEFFSFLCCAHRKKSGLHRHTLKYQSWPKSIIHNRIYVASIDEASNYELISSIGITHLVNCTKNNKHLHQDNDIAMFKYFHAESTSDTKAIDEVIKALIESCDDPYHKIRILLYCDKANNDVMTKIILKFFNDHWLWEADSTIKYLNRQFCDLQVSNNVKLEMSSIKPSLSTDILQNTPLNNHHIETAEEKSQTKERLMQLSEMMNSIMDINSSPSDTISRISEEAARLSRSGEKYDSMFLDFASEPIPEKEPPEQKLLWKANGTSYGVSGLIKIGRNRKNDVVIPDMMVSGVHCVIENGVLIDHGSTNGTLINSKMLRHGVPHVLQNGDEIMIGETKLIVGSDPSSSPEASPPRNMVKKNMDKITPMRIGMTPARGNSNKNDLDQSNQNHATLVAPLEFGIQSIPQIRNRAEASPRPDNLDSLSDFSSDSNK